MFSILRSLLANTKLAAAFCLVGRALDFATTWVALALGRATEAKPGTAQVIHSIGPWMGLIIWEFAITTPVIFLGCTLARRTCRFRWPGHGDAAAAHELPAENPLFYFVGLISFVIGLHNYGYLY
jgi:hypothetical protein